MVLAAGFSWFHLIPGVADDTLLPGVFGFEGSHETHVLVAAWFSCAVVLFGAILARLGLERAKKRNGIEKYRRRQTDDSERCRSVCVWHSRHDE